MTNKLLPILLFLITAHTASAGKPDSVSGDKFEGVLRADYFTCTGDTAQRPVSELVAWKHRIDSLIGLPGFNRTAKEYQRKTGRSPVKDGPCAVALWKRRTDSLRAVDSAAAKEKADLLTEVNSLPKLPCALAGIPFGITRQSFVMLAGKAHLGMLSDQGETMLCQKVPVGERFLPGQFHFDKDGKLDKYELEGPSFPVDSLYAAVWPLAEQLALFFRNALGTPPLRVNRVDRQDIVEGKLSICNVWSDPKWSVSIGLSVQKFRYYAKAVVTNRPLSPEE